MESRRVYRNNLVIYPDLYYVWTYMPPELYKDFYKQTPGKLYKKHICGIGFYSRLHARHVIGNTISKKALLYIHIVRGSSLIKNGITEIPKKYHDRIFVNSPYTQYGDRKIRKWIYPPEFNYDNHRRRHFILYLVRSAETKGPRAFNQKYKRYFNGYRESITVRNYLKKRRKIFHALVQELREANGLPKEGIQYDTELLSAYNKKMAAIHRQKKKEFQEKVLEASRKLD